MSQKPSDSNQLNDGPNTTFAYNPDTDIPSLDDKVIFITGANSGLGKQTALELAKHSPAHIYMTARDSEKGKAAITEVQRVATPGTEISFIALDLTSLASIKEAVQRFVAASERLDILYLNAGILGSPAGQTQEGYEIQMGTNHVGHALLLKLLTPTLEATASSTGSKPRVLSLTSIGYKYLDPPVINFAALKTPDGGVKSMQRYMQSKLASILYAREFAARHPQVVIVSVHPGEVATQLAKREPGDDFVRYLQTEVAPKRTYGVEQGVKNQLWAATAGDEVVVSGEYYEPVGEGGRLGEIGKDEAMAKELWEWTQRELEGHDI